MTEAEFHDAVRASMRKWPEQRYGQAVFNVLREAYPEIAEHVLGTELDPFFFDERVPALLVFMADWLRYGEVEAGIAREELND